MPYQSICSSVASGFQPFFTGCLQRRCRFFQYLRLGDRQVLGDVLDAPALGRHLERELGVGEAVELARQPGLRHLEVRDEALALARRHRAGQGDLRKARAAARIRAPADVARLSMPAA